jgi:hypothetical protein
MRLVFVLTSLGTIGIFPAMRYSKPIIIVLFLMVFIRGRLQRKTGLGSPILEGIVYKKKVPKISIKWMLIGILVANK